MCTRYIVECIECNTNADDELLLILYIYDVLASTTLARKYLCKCINNAIANELRKKLRLHFRQISPFANVITVFVYKLKCWNKCKKASVELSSCIETFRYHFSTWRCICGLCANVENKKHYPASTVICHQWVSFIICGCRGKSARIVQVNFDRKRWLIGICKESSSLQNANSVEMNFDSYLSCVSTCSVDDTHLKHGKYFSIFSLFHGTNVMSWALDVWTLSEVSYTKYQNQWWTEQILILFCVWVDETKHISSIVHWTTQQSLEKFCAQEHIDPYSMHWIILRWHIKGDTCDTYWNPIEDFVNQRTFEGKM